METLKIDLRKYTNRSRRYWTHSKSFPEYGLRENGLRAAKDYGLAKKAGSADQIILETVAGIPVEEPFLKALLGPTARKLGPQVLMDKLVIAAAGTEDQNFAWEVKRYLNAEADRMLKRAEKKKAEKDTVWMRPQWFFVPEIGTKLILQEDWEFALYQEHRNSKLFDQIGYINHNGMSWYGRNLGSIQITLLRSSILTVDRIYVRKGVKDYSSLTFHLRKGSQAMYNGGLYDMKGARFWAKLADVNRIYASVDRNSVPGLECEDEPETTTGND